MGKKSTLLDDVLANAGRAKPGYAGWFDRLPAEAREELDAARNAFNPNIHQKKTFAKAVIAAAQARGWEISGVQGVIAWLQRGR